MRVPTLFLAGCTVLGCVLGCAEGTGTLSPGPAGQTAPDATPDGAAGPVDFIHRQGTMLVTGDGEPFRFQGVTFSSYYWGPTRDSILHSVDHSAADFGRVAELGMNAVQLILSYRLLEDDAAPYAYRDEGWAWLDEQVRVAKDNGLRVLFDLLLVPGGDWHDTTKPADFRLWTDGELRRRYVELWRAIARRYAEEPAIAAFSLLNEPVTTDADGASWWSLAGEAIGAIRSVDSRHLIIVDPLAGVSGSYGLPDAVPAQVLLDDPNLLYDVHFYEPSDYVNQGAPWILNAPTDGGRYPDDTRVTAVGTLDWVGGDAVNPTLPAGDSDWQRYEGALYLLDDSRAVVAYPAVECRNLTPGATAYFDEFVVREYDAAGALLRVIGEGGVTEANASEWYPWSPDGSGLLAIAPTEGHADSYAVAIGGASAIALFSTRTVMFMVSLGHSYQISGWAKGTALDPGTRCQFTLGFYQPGPGASVASRGPGLLGELLRRRLAFGEDHGVPMAVTEFGLMRTCFEGDRGGVHWLTDVVNLFDQYQLGYFFFTYHSDTMGIYGDESVPPSPASELVAITDFFRGRLAGGQP